MPYFQSHRTLAMYWLDCAWIAVDLQSPAAESAIVHPLAIFWIRDE